MACAAKGMTKAHDKISREKTISADRRCSSIARTRMPATQRKSGPAAERSAAAGTGVLIVSVRAVGLCTNKCGLVLDVNETQ